MEFLVNSRILWITKRVTQKQTHFRYFFGGFSVWISYDVLREATAERQFDGMEAD